MTLDHWVALFSTVISFVGLVFVAVQLRDANRQRESDSLVKIYDINRELLSLGFSHPQLFAILNDADNADPVWERRYLQLWLNQLSLIHTYLKRSTIRGELKDSLEQNVGDFMTMNNMRRQWHERGKAYPASFQKLVNDMIEKHEPPPPAAHVKGTASQAAKT
jgi:hypothetical protein